MSLLYQFREKSTQQSELDIYNASENSNNISLEQTMLATRSSDTNILELYICTSRYLSTCFRGFQVVKVKASQLQRSA